MLKLATFNFQKWLVVFWARYLSLTSTALSVICALPLAFVVIAFLFTQDIRAQMGWWQVLPVAGISLVCGRLFALSIIHWIPPVYGNEELALSAAYPETVMPEGHRICRLQADLIRKTQGPKADAWAVQTRLEMKTTKVPETQVKRPPRL